MPIIQPKVPSKTEAFGDLFGGITSGILQGTLAKKKQAQDDAMKIWQMAQADPLVLQSPQAQRAFKLAGWPVPEVRRQDINALLGEDASDFGVTGFSTDPATGNISNIRRGRTTDNTSATVKQLMELRHIAQESGNFAQVDAIEARLAELLPQLGIQVAEPAPTPVKPSKPGFFSRLFGGGAPTAAAETTPTPTPTPAPNPLGAPTMPLPALGEIANQWLQPGAFTGPMPQAGPVTGIVPNASQAATKMSALDRLGRAAGRIPSVGLSSPMPGAMQQRFGNFGRQSTGMSPMNIGGAAPMPVAAPQRQYRYRAINPQTGQRVGSDDGVTWTPLQ